MATLEQAIIDAALQHLRPRGNATGPITAEDHQAVTAEIAAAIGVLEDLIGGGGLVFFDYAGEPAPELGGTGTVAWGTKAGDIWQKLESGAWDYKYTVSNGQTQGGGAPFDADFVVSLSGGKSFGKFTSGQTVPASGKTANEVILLAAIESIYPTYSVAALSLAASQPALGEVGASVTVDLTATFARGDAGALAALRIKQAGTLLGLAGTTSPLTRSATITRTLAGTSFQAFADYAAGTAKPVPPGNAPDDRTPAVRNPNAPQAAETDLSSNAITLAGLFPWFCGSSDTDTVPAIYATGTKVITASNGQLLVPSFGAGTKWLWFAVPRNADGSQQKLFTTWYRTALNAGSIGGATNLFRSPVIESVSSTGLATNWTRDYDLYFTNYAAVADVATTLN